MTTKKFCNNCGKELERNWLEIKHIYKEMDFGQELTVMEADVCSVKCGKETIEKHYRPREKFCD